MVQMVSPRAGQYRAGFRRSQMGQLIFPREFPVCRAWPYPGSRSRRFRTAQDECFGVALVSSESSNCAPDVG